MYFSTFRQSSSSSRIPKKRFGLLKKIKSIFKGRPKLAVQPKKNQGPTYVSKPALPKPLFPQPKPTKRLGLLGKIKSYFQKKREQAAQSKKNQQPTYPPNLPSEQKESDRKTEEPDKKKRKHKGLNCDIHEARKRALRNGVVVSSYAPPAVFVTVLGLAFFNHFCLLYGSGYLVRDMWECKDRWNIKLDPPANLDDVFTKKVVQLQIVERPIGHCGHKSIMRKYNTSEMYGEKTIKCLRCEGIKTSISGKTDRLMHSGMVVKTEDGNKYLIHKGQKFGTRDNRTIIEVANDSMYDKGYEKVGDPITPKNTARTVEEYFRKSGSSYDFKNNNCHDGTLRMKDLANKP